MFSLLETINFVMKNGISHNEYVENILKRMKKEKEDVLVSFYIEQTFTPNPFQIKLGKMFFEGKKEDIHLNSLPRAIGKSFFIENLGTFLSKRGVKVFEISRLKMFTPVSYNGNFDHRKELGKSVPMNFDVVLCDEINETYEEVKQFFCMKPSIRIVYLKSFEF